MVLAYAECRSDCLGIVATMLAVYQDYLDKF
jgi:hypothetical protein